MGLKRSEPVHLEWFPPESFPDRDALCAFADSPQSDGYAFLRGLRSVLQAHALAESEGGLPERVLADARQALCAVVSDIEQLFPRIVAAFRDPDLVVEVNEALAFEPVTRQRLCAAFSQAVAFFEVEDPQAKRLLLLLARYSVREPQSRGTAVGIPLRPRRPRTTRDS